MLGFRKKIFITDLLFFSASLIALFFIFPRQQALGISFFLGVYICMNQLVLFHFTRPIRDIIHAIVSYRQGGGKDPSHIDLKSIDGEFNELACTLNSLTTRVQKQIEDLTEQREETAAILESIGEGIIATDTSAKITFINQAACALLGVSREKILHSMLNLESDLSRKCHELILDALQTSEVATDTVNLRDKEPLYLNLISAPLARQNGALIVLQDKTSDYKIVELGKDFIANASHELRTPITIIRGFAETLQDLPELSKEMLHDITEKIVRTCIRLDKLVRSLLTLSDIENLSKKRLKLTDLTLIAENCKHHLLVANPNVVISLDLPAESVPIIADADLLELAILNLLENAVKYSASPPQIELRIEKNESGNILQIQDRGIGISDRDLPHIFNRFYTVDKARSRKSGGAGLGLSIVKTIVEKHRGQISVNSEMGVGTTFTMTLPNRESSS
jgi:two-component system phosphate regulon sensor histidine kinase PhoR